jgi:precorrin-4 methylase
MVEVVLDTRVGLLLMLGAKQHLQLERVQGALPLQETEHLAEQVEVQVKMVLLAQMVRVTQVQEDLEEVQVVVHSHLLLVGYKLVRTIKTYLKK